LQPDDVVWGSTGLGPNWLRERLPAKALVNHFLVVESVYADTGPGMRPVSNISGEYRDLHPIVVTDTDLSQIARFARLHYLYLREMPITDAGIWHLRNLRHVKHLYLSFTRITDESMDVLAGFEELEMLRLVGTQVTDAGLAKLTNLQHLEELDVRDTRVTSSGLDPFRGRPGLRLLGNGDDDPYRGLMFSY
jgi:hypothetical protein